MNYKYCHLLWWHRSKLWGPLKGPCKKPNKFQIAKSNENLIIFACSFCFYNIRELNSLYRNSHPLGRNYFETELKVEDLSGGLFWGLKGLKMAQNNQSCGIFAIFKFLQQWSVKFSVQVLSSSVWQLIEIKSEGWWSLKDSCIGLTGLKEAKISENLGIFINFFTVLMIACLISWTGTII